MANKKHWLLEYMHHAQFLDERREMMQWWAEYLEKEVRNLD